MDTSETYIKMCEKAVEIQVLRPHLLGDFRYSLVLNKIEIIDKESWMDDQEIYIWLPRQDQLQAMVFDGMGLQDVCTAMEQFSKSDVGLSITINGTMEQLLLAWVMLHKYKKTWNGSDWISQTS